METCEVCGLTAKEAKHPCRFAKACDCWRGRPCKANRLNVFVDGVPMATVNGQSTAEGMADVYRQINPGSEVTIAPIPA